MPRKLSLEAFQRLSAPLSVAAREPEEGTPTDGHPPLAGDLGPDWVEKKGPDFFGSEDWEEVK